MFLCVSVVSGGTGFVVLCLTHRCFIPVLCHLVVVSSHFITPSLIYFLLSLSADTAG